MVATAPEPEGEEGDDMDPFARPRPVPGSVRHSGIIQPPPPKPPRGEAESQHGVKGVHNLGFEGVTQDVLSAKSEPLLIDFDNEVPSHNQASSGLPSRDHTQAAMLANLDNDSVYAVVQPKQRRSSDHSVTSLPTQQIPTSNTFHGIPVLPTSAPPIPRRTIDPFPSGESQPHTKAEVAMDVNENMKFDETEGEGSPTSKVAALQSRLFGQGVPVLPGAGHPKLSPKSHRSNEEGRQEPSHAMSAATPAKPDIKPKPGLAPKPSVKAKPSVSPKPESGSMGPDSSTEATAAGGSNRMSAMKAMFESQAATNPDKPPTGSRPTAGKTSSRPTIIRPVTKRTETTAAAGAATEEQNQGGSAAEPTPRKRPTIIRPASQAMTDLAGLDVGQPQPATRNSTSTGGFSYLAGMAGNPLNITQDNDSTTEDWTKAKPQQTPPPAYSDIGIYPVLPQSEPAPGKAKPPPARPPPPKSAPNQASSEVPQR